MPQAIVVEEKRGGIYSRLNQVEAGLQAALSTACTLEALWGRMTSSSILISQNFGTIVLILIEKIIFLLITGSSLGSRMMDGSPSLRPRPWPMEPLGACPYSTFYPVRNNAPVEFLRGGYLTRFRVEWFFGGFLSLSSFLFSTFSLKRVFFKLTALMMQ